MSSEQKVSENKESIEFEDFRLRRKEEIAGDIWLFEFEHRANQLLAPYAPGAHITVQTPSGMRRQYSLCDSGAMADHYSLAIKAEQNGRGASLSMVNNAQVGAMFPLSSPQNSFPLDESERYLFIAGGIGITPIMSMLRHLESMGHTGFQLIYCTRDRASTPFLEELNQDFYRDKVVIHHDDGNPDKIYDLWPLFETPEKSLVYCCGPQPMMEEVLDMSGHWPSGAIRLEHFASDVEAVREDDTAFVVRHAESAQTFQIPKDATILETLRAAGLNLPSSCESGACGSCRVELVDGIVDHRDIVLQPHERDAYMMICVSRARSAELILRW